MAGRFAIVGIVAALALSAGSTVAHAAAAVIVSPNSPLTSLSAYQVTDIFLGRITRLPNGDPVVPIDLKEGSPVRHEFYMEFTGKSRVQLKAYWSKLIFTGRGKPPIEAADAAAMKAKVAKNPDAIGYVDSEMVDDTVRVLTIR